MDPDMTHQIHFPLFCSLGGNLLGDLGGAAVAEALKVNTSLQNLK